MHAARSAALAMFCALAAVAHPMGNFSVSHYSRLELSGEGVRLLYVLDLAEIPTLELMQKWGVDLKKGPVELDKYLMPEAAGWIANLDITSKGSRKQAKLESAEISLSPGAGNMPEARIEMKAVIQTAPGSLNFEDRNFAGRTGWKELIVVARDGAKIVSSSAPTIERTAALKSYPMDPSITPPQIIQASVDWIATGTRPMLASGTPFKESPIGPRISQASSRPGSIVAGDFLSTLLGREALPFHLVLLGLAVAFGLGAAHALSPGHGKTMVAAYLVGNRGTLRHAFILGSTVTLTHTCTVFMLGFVTMFLSRYIVPEKLYPILATISGLTIVWLGATLLYRRVGGLRMRQGHEHDSHHHGPLDHVHSHADHDHHHAHGQEHHHHYDHGHGHHHDHSHDHVHHHHHGDHDHYAGDTHGSKTHSHTHSHMPEGDITLGSLLALGVSGGLVPCPSGLVLLLSSIAAGRVGLGLLLLVGFSAGLASVLIAIGMLVVSARHLLPRTGLSLASPALRFVPVLSATVIFVIGIAMTAVSIGWAQPLAFLN